MSVLNKINKLKALQSKILSSKEINTNQDYFLKYEQEFSAIQRESYFGFKDLDRKDEAISFKLEKKQIPFLFSKRLEELHPNAKQPETESSCFSGSSPLKVRKSPAILPKKPLSTPPPRGNSEDFLSEARTPEYLNKLIKLEEKVKEEIVKLEQELNEKRKKMTEIFKNLILENGLQYDAVNAEKLLGELFDIIYRGKGVFEQLVQAFSKEFIKKLEKNKKEEDVFVVLKSSENIRDIALEAGKVYLIQDRTKIKYRASNPKGKKDHQGSTGEIIKPKEPFTQENLSFYQVAIESKLKSDIGWKKKEEIKDETTLAIKILKEIRDEAILVNDKLFESLGKVSTHPASYFDLTEESKVLSKHVMELLYGSDNFVRALEIFQQEKKKSINLNILNEIIALQNQMDVNLLFFDQHQIINIKEVTEKHLQRLEGFSLSSHSFNEESTQLQYGHMKKLLERLTSSAAESTTCLSCFPLEVNRKGFENSRYICLVTTSGDVNKLKKENFDNNKKALVAFQSKIKELLSQEAKKAVNGRDYEFVYHDAEYGMIDPLLQQVNLAFSAKKDPLIWGADISNDPFRACAEKKFLAYIRDQINSPDIEGLKILGASNLSMPIVPESKYLDIFQTLRRDLYETAKKMLSPSSLEALDGVLKKLKENSIAEQRTTLDPQVELSEMAEKLEERFLAESNVLLKGAPTLLEKFQKEKTDFLKNFHLNQKKREELYELSLFNLKNNGKKVNTYSIEIDRHHFLILDFYANLVLKLKNYQESDFQHFLKEQEAKIIANFKDVSESVSQDNLSYFEKSVEKLKQDLNAGTDPMLLSERYTKHLDVAKSRVKLPSVFSISLSSSDVMMETRFIDCCTDCVANKLPVLTWLADLQESKKDTQLTPEIAAISFRGRGVSDLEPSIFNPVKKRLTFSN